MKPIPKIIGCIGTVLTFSSCVSGVMAYPKPVHTKIDKLNTSLPPVNTNSEGLYTQKPLAGLTGVCVCVENINEDAKKDGLDPAQLKVEIELRLRKAGVTVYDAPSNGGNDSMATLDANISTLKNDYGLYGYTLSLNLTELVRTIRSTPRYCMATTWTTGYFGMVGADKMAPKLRQAVDDEADEFANDYLAQNPK